MSEVFYFAQKAVLHPTAPLYDSREHVLKKECVAALRRIFKLCDMNKDGVLDAAELNEFQVRPLSNLLYVPSLIAISSESVSTHLYKRRSSRASRTWFDNTPRAVSVIMGSPKPAFCICTPSSSSVADWRQRGRC